MSPIKYLILRKNHMIYFYVDLYKSRLFWLDVIKSIGLIAVMIWIIKNVNSWMCKIFKDDQDDDYEPVNQLPCTSYMIKVFLATLICKCVLDLILEFFLFHVVIQYDASY